MNLRTRHPRATLPRVAGDNPANGMDLTRAHPMQQARNGNIRATPTQLPGDAEIVRCVDV